MDIITEKMTNMNMSMCSEDDMIDFLCSGLQNTKLVYTNNMTIDEYRELEEAFRIQTMGKDILIKTVDRYTRYINEIEVWEIGDISCLYIKEYIELFIKESNNGFTNESTVRLLQLMKYIDSEIMRLLDTM
jgi:hypothetical protein